MKIKRSIFVKFIIFYFFCGGHIGIRVFRANITRDCGTCCSRILLFVFFYPIYLLFPVLKYNLIYEITQDIYCTTVWVSVTIHAN